MADHLLFRHAGQPTRGAWEALTTVAALAEVTEPEYDAFGFRFDRRVDRFEEAIQIYRHRIIAQLCY